MGSPRSRPGRSSRWSSWPSRARSTRRSTSFRGCRRSDGGDAELGLHFDLTVPFARYVLENAQAAELPVPALPDPEGVARGTAAGGPVPRVHPGRHRHRRRRQAGRPPRRRAAAGHPGGAGAAARRSRGPAGADAGQQPQLAQGFYLGLGIDDPLAVLRGSTSSTRSAPDRVVALLAANSGWRARRTLLALATSPRRTPPSSTGCSRLGVSTRCWTRAWSCWPTWSCTAARRARAVVADLKIARGLDYYTGTVYETELAGFELAGVDLLGRPLRLAGLRRPDHLPGRGPLHRRDPDPGAAARPGGCAPPGRCRVACWSRWTPRRPGGRRRGRGPAAGPGDRDRGRPGADRFGKQIRYADRREFRTSGSPPARGQGHPQRRAGAGRPRAWEPPADDLRPQVRWNP